MCGPRPCSSMWPWLTRRGVRKMSYRGGGRGRGPNRGGGRGGRPGRPPPGLSGKEIGMFYARRGKERKIERERKERTVVTINRDTEQSISRILDSVRHTTPSAAEPVDATDSPVATSYYQFPSAPTPAQFVSDSELLDDLRHQQSLPMYARLLEFRQQLPAWSMKDALLSAIASNQVVVISGETGCGKTTQVAQFVLDDCILRGCGSKCHVICTQPRRISAITVAQRVAAERAESLGKSSGYQIRLERILPREKGSILYCTTGVLLRRMLTDPLLEQASHIILDEVHERNNVSDFLTIIIRDLLPRRPDLKLVLMSATINADLFSKYFNDAPMISIPGRVFPVKEFYLEDILEMTGYRPQPSRTTDKRPFWTRYSRGKQDWLMKQKEKEELEAYLVTLEQERRYRPSVIDSLREMDDSVIDLQLVVTLLRHICRQDEGAVLVFLPGWDTISKLHDMLKSDVMFRSSSQYIIIPLHSMMPTTTQRQVFERPPRGVRKIIIATNIAETSITIDDVVYVVDCGKVKETTYDADNQLAMLQAVWVSKAAARQRRGRAGRVKPGQCYHLFTHHRHNKMADFQLPEMLRTPLEELVLQIKVLKLGLARDVLGKALESPSEQSVTNAINTLTQLQALTPSEDLTPLGYHLANLPVHPRVGRMILFAAMFSCLDPVLTIASTLGFKDPFVLPLNKQEEADRVKKEFASDSQSDHIAFLNAFRGWESSRRSGPGEARRYCWDKFLANNTMEMLHDMKKQFVGLLHDIGFVCSNDPKEAMANVNSDNIKLVKAVLCAGLYPNVAKIVPGKRSAKLYTQLDGKVEFHPKSVNCNVPSFSNQFLIYHTKVKSSAIYIHDATVIPPFPLLFFGGNIGVGRDQDQETITVDDWIVFQAPQRIAQLVKDLRSQLDVTLQEKIAHPKMELYTPGSHAPSPSSLLIQAIIDLITSEDYSDQAARLAAGKHLYYRK